MTASVTGIGHLNRRLVLEAPTENDDGAGGVARSYQAVTTLWAKVTPLTARADVSADSLGAALRFRIVIRNRHDVTPRHRLREGARLFRVIAACESDDRRFIEIDAEERGE